jgi:hypothetical protein
MKEQYDGQQARQIEPYTHTVFRSFGHLRLAQYSCKQSHDRDVFSFVREDYDQPEMDVLAIRNTIRRVHSASHSVLSVCVVQTRPSAKGVRVVLSGRSCLEIRVDHPFSAKPLI